MTSPPQTRVTRSRAIESKYYPMELKSLESKKLPTERLGKSKTQPASKSASTPRNSGETFVEPTAGHDHNLESEDDGAGNDEHHHASEQATQPDAFAPSRKSPVNHIKLRSKGLSSKLPWTGLENGGDVAIDDQASISDLDMHGSVSSDDDISDGHDANDYNDVDDVCSISESLDGAVEEEIDIADDDDDYGDVDNVSDTSEHSDQFEREVEAAWQQDDIDWNDEYVYRYDDGPNRGFLVDEEFLSADLDHIWSNWQIQFLDFGNRAPVARSAVIADAPIHDSALVRRVEEINMNERARDRSYSASSDSSTQSNELSQEASSEGSRIEDDAGDDTEDDLPEESQNPSQTPRLPSSLRRSSTSSSSTTVPTSSRRRPVMHKMPLDNTRVTAFSLPTPNGKFVRRVTLPLESSTEWVTVPGKHRHNQNSSPTSSISTELSYQDSMLYNAINGRLFQKAHFTSFGPPLTSIPIAMPAHNSFLSGPALHESSLYDDDDDEFMGFEDETYPVMTDLGQLVDFDALTSHREFYPPSGRIRAQSADVPSIIELEPGSTCSTKSTSANTLEGLTELPPSTPPNTETSSKEVPIQDSNSPLAVSTSTPKKRRSSNTSDTPMLSPSPKRKRTDRK